MIHWQKLVDRSDLSQDELKQIPSDNIICYSFILDTYIKNSWPIDKLLEGTGLVLEDFNNFSRWLNVLESDKLIKNFFNNAPVFLSHKSVTSKLSKRQVRETVLHTIIKYTEYDDIMADPNKTTKKLENNSDYTVSLLGNHTYSLRVTTKKFKKDSNLGHELYISFGYLELIHSIKRIQISQISTICYEADLNKIICFFYNGHGFIFGNKSIYLNGEVFASKISARYVTELDGLFPWKDEIVYKIEFDYFYNDELIFKKGDIYNAPFSYCLWRINSFHYYLDKLHSSFYKFMKLDAKKLESQLEENNSKSKDLLQIKTVMDNDKKSKEIFLAKVVHEIKSPLASIVMLIDSIGDHIGIVPDFVEDGFSQLSDKTSKLINFVDNVMSYFSIDNSHFSLSYEVFDLAFLFNDVLDSFSHVSKDKEIKIICTIAPDLYFIKGDYYRLLQVFLNIINNSVKFTLEGSIEISANFSNHYINISVRDTGIGIKPELLPEIFKKFSMAEFDLSENGLGLGLFIAKEIISQHNGVINVNSEYGVGTEFIVSLPYYAE